MKKITGITVDPSMNAEREGIDFILVPVCSEEKDENGEHPVIRYERESVK